MITHSFKFFLIVVAITIPLTSSALPQEVKSMTVTRQPVVREFNPAFKGKPEQMLEDLEHQVTDARRLKDAAKLDALLADDITYARTKLEKKKLIEMLTETTLNYYSMEKSQMVIQFNLDSAVITGIQRSEIEIEGGSKFIQFSFWTIWKRIDGVWRCVELSY